MMGGRGRKEGEKVEEASRRPPRLCSASGRTDRLGHGVFPSDGLLN